MLEVTTSWNIPSGIETKSVMYFGSGVPLSAARARVRGAFNGFMDSIATGVSFSVDTTARVLNAATGALEGIEIDATPQTATGAGSGLVVADATQVLLTWTTGLVLDGRFVQGRTFIPGLDANLLSGGNLSPGAQADFQAAITAMVSPPAGFGIWHRPKPGREGAHVVATGGIARSELAVLRRRRG